jgi:hypothetical protein
MSRELVATAMSRGASLKNLRLNHPRVDGPRGDLVLRFPVKVSEKDYRQKLERDAEFARLFDLVVGHNGFAFGSSFAVFASTKTELRLSGRDQSVHNTDDQ